MKTKFNQFILLAFFALLSFTACQNEETQVINPSEQETIVPSSALAGLMSNTTANYGAYDDVLDGSPCFSIDLPVTIVISDITITIESEEDLDELEDLFEQFEGNEDILDFIFPITIIFNDYTEIVIENEGQLENFITDCDDDEDDVIECIDFVYPISFSVFNADFDVIDTVTIENDEALYHFLEELEEDDNALIVSLNYPVTLEYANGETIEVNSNEELAEAIELASNDCDDDDEEYECNEDNIAELLVECPWDIDDEFNDFDDYQITFNEDGTLEISEGNATSAIGGNWELATTDDGLKLILSDLTTFDQDLGGVWIITECDDDELIIERGDFTIELDQDCDDDEVDCSVGEIYESIVECAWLFETNLIDTTVAVYVYFTPDGHILNANADETESVIGAWELTLTGSHIYFDFEFESEFEVLNGLWRVAECEDDELYLINEDNYIQLYQECDDENPFECYETDGIELVECDEDADGYAVFNIYEAVPDCSSQNTLIISFHTTEEGAVSNTDILEVAQAYSSISNPQAVYVKVALFDNQEEFYIYPVYLISENCSPFECFESFEAVIEKCDEDNDGIEVFDLTVAFSNCTPSAEVVTYHETEADALNGINAILYPEAYTNVYAEQILFIRVQIENQTEIFPIFLYLEDCSQGVCAEGDVDEILAECFWIPTSFNGDDNLIDWVLNFEANSQAVVMTNGETAVTAIYTTSGSADGVIVEFSNITGPDIQVLTGSWLVVECSSEFLHLQNGDINLILERTCD